MDNQVIPRRKTQLNFVVGINGTGKTTWLRDNVVNRHPKALVLTPDDAEWRDLIEVRTDSDVRNLQSRARIIYQGPETIETIKRNYSGGALIMDDAMSYMKFFTDDTMRYIYIRRRQRGIDIYFTTHGLRQIPPQAFTYGSFLILFASVENFADRKKELQPDTFQRIIEAQQQLARDCEKGKRYNYKIIRLDPTI